LAILHHENASLDGWRKWGSPKEHRVSGTEIHLASGKRVLGDLAGFPEEDVTWLFGKVKQPL